MLSAVAVPVPLAADPESGCRVAWNTLDGTGRVRTAVLVEVDGTSEVGRVTFEGLDSIRVSRGEVLPYATQGGDATSWVFRVLDSPWLAERHRYEQDVYQYPLEDTHDHLVLQLHDEFVEVVAAGLWFDLAPADDPFALTPTHPLASLPAEDEVATGRTAELDWNIRQASHGQDDLLAASALGSQRLLDLTVELEDRLTWTCWVRTRDGRTTTRLDSLLDTARPELTVEGVASIDDVLPHWERRCAEIAESRHSQGRRSRH